MFAIVKSQREFIGSYRAQSFELIRQRYQIERPFALMNLHRIAPA